MSYVQRLLHKAQAKFDSTIVIKRPWKGAYLFSRQFPRRRRRIVIYLE